MIRSLRPHLPSLAAGAALALGIVALPGMAQVQYTRAPNVPPLVTGLTPEQVEILSLMSLVHLPDGQGGECRTLRISGVDVQIVNGLGATGTTNCRGNLIVGYNELGNQAGDQRTGSHNVVVGSRQSYGSFGGLVAGQDNQVLAPYASVTGGNLNRALGNHSSVSGGTNNEAFGDVSSILGGRTNTAFGGGTCVVGGQVNTASSAFTSILGGQDNMATELWSTVCGGHFNVAGGRWSNVGGGNGNAASHQESTVSGGCGLSTGAVCEHLP